MTRKVLVTDIAWANTDVESDVLRSVDADLVLAPAASEAELVDLAGDADAILTCFAQVTAAVVAAAPRLRVISRYGIGVDNIAVAEATKRGILVTNVPDYCADEVVEHVLALALSLARGLRLYDQGVRTGDWSLQLGLPTRRLRGRTLGIIGYGAIGRLLADRAQGLGLDVIVHTQRRSADVSAAGFTPVSLEELASKADIVSLHVPLTPSTRGMIDESFLAMMRPTASLINTARGAVVDQVALVEALRNGVIESAGLDVFEPERLPIGHPLLGLRNVVLTPHTAYYSAESIRNLARLAATSVAAVLNGRRPAAVVNPELLHSKRWAHLEV